MPDHLKQSSEPDKLKFLKRAAFLQIFGGLALIMVLTDPMVDALAEFSRRIEVPPFYVAFILAPLASSSLEMISSASYAAKKSIKVTALNMSLKFCCTVAEPVLTDVLLVSQLFL